MKKLINNQLKQYCLFNAETIRLTLAAFVAFIGICLLPNLALGQNLILNDLEYFEKQGVNIMVFSDQFNGMFFDEKTAGIEMIHHGVRT
jgi:endoglucanase